MDNRSAKLIASPLFVLVLFMVALCTGVTFGALAGFVSGDWKQIGLPIGAGITGGAWLTALAWWRNMVEVSTGTARTTPEPVQRWLRLEMHNLDTDQSLIGLVANVDPETLTEIAQHVAAGGRVTYRSCAKFFASEEQFAEFQDSLVAAEYATWHSLTSRNHGIDLTPLGYASLRSLLHRDGSQSPASPPTGDSHAHTPPALDPAEGWQTYER